MQQSQTIAAESSTYSAQHVADLVAAVMWTDRLLIDEAMAAQSHVRLGPNLGICLEPPLVSVRPVAEARSRLAILHGELLPCGFEIRALQRAVIDRLASPSLGRE